MGIFAIMTSFKRNLRGSSIDRISGVKSWVNGQRLVSSGIKELDDLLGGGIALGSVTFIENDLDSNLADLLIRYNIGESISQRQKTFLVSSLIEWTGDDNLRNNLPYNVSKGVNHY